MRDLYGEMDKMSRLDSEKYIRSLPAFVFKNEYGEQFNLYCNGTTAFIGGSEIRIMAADYTKIGKEIMPLFNPSFNVWSRDELYKLGEGLMTLNRPEGKNETI